MKLKKLLTLILVVIMSLSVLVACDNSDDPAPEGTDAPVDSTTPDVEEQEVAILTPYISSTTTKQMCDILESGMKAKGWTVTVTDTQNDFAALASRMEDLVTRGVDAIVIVSADPSQITDQVKAADDAGIPVFGCDSGFIDGITVNATSDNAQMSTLISEYLFEQMGDEGNLVILGHRPHPGLLVRMDTLTELLEDHPNINTVIEQHVEVPNPIDNAKTDMDNILLANQGEGAISAVWCGWDEAAIGAVQAIQDAGREGIIVTGIDGNEQAIKMIDDGTALIATIEQNFTGMAEIVVEQLEILFSGTTITPQEMYAPATLYTGK